MAKIEVKDQWSKKAFARGIRAFRNMLHALVRHKGEMNPDQPYRKCARCKNKALRRTAYCILHCKDFSKFEPVKPNKPMRV